MLSNTEANRREVLPHPDFSAGNAKTSLKWLIDFSTITRILCLVPFISSPDGAGKGTQTFRADIEHATAGRIRTWVLARSAASVLPILAFLPDILGQTNLNVGLPQQV